MSVVLVSDADRERLGRIADVMLPSTETMPSATEVEATEALLDAVLGSRPELRSPLLRAVKALDTTDFDLAKLRSYRQRDADAYEALTLCVAAAYYSASGVRERIGYPGQVALTFDPYAYVNWVDEGLLDPVVERGAIWRRPPEVRDASADRPLSATSDTPRLLDVSDPGDGL